MTSVVLVPRPHVEDQRPLIHQLHGFGRPDGETTAASPRPFVGECRQGQEHGGTSQNGVIRDVFEKVLHVGPKKGRGL